MIKITGENTSYAQVLSAEKASIVIKAFYFITIEKETSIKI
jgi:hypothetical protein